MWIRMSALSPERRIADLTARSALRRTGLQHAIHLRIEENANMLKILRRDLNYAMDRRMNNAGTALERLRGKLEAMNPMGVLNRGYALVYDRNGSMLTRKAEAVRHTQMIVRFADGEIEVKQHGTEAGNTGI